MSQSCADQHDKYVGKCPYCHTRLPAALASPAPPAGVGEHDWHERFNLTCCRLCGIVRRADDKNSPCRGVVHVAFRDDAPPVEQEVESRALPAPSPEVEEVAGRLENSAEELRHLFGLRRGGPDDLYEASMLDQAATLLRQQAVENERLKTIAGLRITPETAQERVFEDMREDNERLKGALKPLADMADTPMLRDGEPFEPADSDVLYAGPLTWGDARRARDARAALPVQQEGEG